MVCMEWAHTTTYPLLLQKGLYESVKYRQIPSGELAVRRGICIEAKDGYVGKVEEFVVNPENGHITHMVMREGHL